MTRIEGRRPTPGKGDGQGAGRRRGPIDVRRVGLLAFGAAFLLLFLVIAIAEGVGSPSVPAGDVAIVEGLPGGTRSISEADFKHSLELAAAQGGLKKVPKPGESKYEELQTTALNSLFDTAWIEGLAAEMGISVTPGEIAAKLKSLKKENFKTEAAFRKFLRESHYTTADVDNRVKLTILSTKVQSQITTGAPKPSEGEISDYYEEAKATQFTRKASRNVRLIVNKDPKKAEEAKAQLEKGKSSAATWQKVAKKYSEDPATKSSGGLRSGLAEGMVEEPLNAAIFKTPEKQLTGPIKAAAGYYVFEVESTTPESVQALKDVKSQIESQLGQRTQQEAFATFIANYTSTWKSRTFCAAGYTIERCANFKGKAHPATAPPSCYEAHPKGAAPEACPAPVSQLIPALPGSVNLLEPRGKPMAQRPQPAGLKPGAGAAAAPPGSFAP